MGQSHFVQNWQSKPHQERVSQTSEDNFQLRFSVFSSGKVYLPSSTYFRWILLIIELRLSARFTGRSIHIAASGIASSCSSQKKWLCGVMKVSPLSPSYFIGLMFTVCEIQVGWVHHVQIGWQGVCWLSVSLLAGCAVKALVGSFHHCRQRYFDIL